MSFDQDPNERANISGADLAIMIDELKAANARIRELEGKRNRAVSDYLRAAETAHLLRDQIAAAGAEDGYSMLLDQVRYGMCASFDGKRIDPTTVFVPPVPRPVPLSEWQQMEAALAAANERIWELEHLLTAQKQEWEKAYAIAMVERAISDKLVEALRIVGQALAWNAFGECRSFGENVLLMAPIDADRFSHATLSEVAAIRKGDEK